MWRSHTHSDWPGVVAPDPKGERDAWTMKEKPPPSQCSHYQEVARQTLISAPPRTEHQPPPHSRKSTINHVSSKPDTSPSPAHPHGDHYESRQASILWPNEATHAERPYILPNMNPNVHLKQSTAQMPLSVFSALDTKRRLGESSGAYLSSLAQTKKKQNKTFQLESGGGALYFTAPSVNVFCET